MELIYGRRPVAEALAGRRQVHKIYSTTGPHDEKIAALAETAGLQGVPVAMVDRDELERRCAGVVHQGVAAEVAAYKYDEIGDLLARSAVESAGLVVALDQVTDPQNLGAVIRTTVAAGGDGLLIGKKRGATVTPAVVKASAGLTERASIVQTNLSSALRRLKEAGFWVVGADSGGVERHWDLDLKGKIVIVLGSEGAGLSRLVRESCDWLAALPLAAGVDSLNVSAAAAVFLYEALRQRRSE